MENQSKNKTKFSKDDIKIAVRVRPLLDRERTFSNVESIQIMTEDTLLITTDNSPSMENKNLRKYFSFDFVFGSSSSQVELYEKTTKSQLKYLLEGYNVSIFAYGTTGSGKTFSCFFN